RQEVDDPDDVADSRLQERHRLPSVADRAQTEHLLADRLPAPERLARPEIAEDDDETSDEAEQVGHGVRAELADRERREVDTRKDTEDDEEVEQVRDAARREAGHLVVERHPLRRRDDEVAVAGGRFAHLVVIVVACARKTSSLFAETI